jgi:hypothetical protein
MAMSGEDKKLEWSKELEKVGLTEEVFQNIIAASPAKQIVPGYPQDWIQAFSIQENW